MNSNAKKIEIAAYIDGEEGTFYIQCDLDESGDHPTAVLWWPTTTDGSRVVRQLEKGDIAPNISGGSEYVHTGNPIPIPKALDELRPPPLSETAFRLGFFRIEGRPDER